MSKTTHFNDHFQNHLKLGPILNFRDPAHYHPKMNVHSMENFKPNVTMSQMNFCDILTIAFPA